MLRSISAKFAAPFLLFLLPIAFLLFFLVNTHDKGIATARNEISGLASIHAALNLSTAVLRASGRDSPRAGEARPGDSLEMAAVHAAARAAQSVFAAEIDLRAGSDHAQRLLQQASSTAGQLQAKTSLAPEQATQAIEQFAGLVSAIGDVSELILDPELDTYYLMDMLVNHQPETLVLLAYLRREELAAANVAGPKPDVHVRTVGYQRALNGLLLSAERAHDALIRHARDEHVAARFSPAFRTYAALLDNFDVGRGSTGPMGVTETFLPDLIDAAGFLQHVAGEELKRLLNHRISKIRQARDHQIVLSLLMFVLAVVAMLLLLTFLVNRPVRSLTLAMRGLARGDVSIELGLTGRRDEIGAMSRAVAVFRDNAIRKQMLEARARRDALALELTASTLLRAERIGNMGNWRHDFMGHATTWSAQLLDMAGFDPALGQPRLRAVLERTEPADRAKLRALLSEAASGLGQGETMIGYRHPERGLRCFRIVVETETDAEGHLQSMVGAVHDITTLKDNERKLEARTEALAEAQAMGRIGNWSCRLGEQRIEWSDEIHDLLRLDSATRPPGRSDLLARCVGDSARMLLEAEAEVMRTRGVKSVDVTLQRGDGSLGDFTMTSKLDLNADGQAIGLFGTIQDISERKNAERELEKLAYYDPLSGLANRALFQRAIRRAIDETRASGRTGTLLLMDLDRFKEVNDSLGHHAGDELLVKVSEVLRRSLPPDAFLARLGGDEFAAILGACTREGAMQIARSLVGILSSPIQLSMGEVSVGTSIGIAMIVEDGTTPDELLGHADLALYQAKDSGRACAEFFHPAMSEFAQDKIMMARDLAHAISSDTGLYLVYQPQVDLASGCVTGFEALLRWQHPVRGNIPPSDFVPIAESSKLISDLGQWVLRAACRQIRDWRDAGHPLREVAVNVSAAQFWHTDMEQDISRALAEVGIAPQLLCIEVTESVFVREAEGRVRRALDQIRQLGVQLALDDFGTGYSSLAYLNRFPFDKLKVDRSFIDHVDLDPERLKLLQGIVSMARALGKRTIAEGAERSAEVAVLVSLGCDVVQGYVYSRPLQADEAMIRAAELEEAALRQSTAAA
ncbi:MAG: EAL domain-containing protein [Beijerinckiaceae bacterium]|nr:EAL domain-containing protein [Beijerinckiaceae bacterium]